MEGGDECAGAGACEVILGGYLIYFNVAKIVREHGSARVLPLSTASNTLSDEAEVSLHELGSEEHMDIWPLHIIFGSELRVRIIRSRGIYCRLLNSLYMNFSTPYSIFPWTSTLRPEPGEGVPAAQTSLAPGTSHSAGLQ